MEDGIKIPVIFWTGVFSLTALTLGEPDLLDAITSRVKNGSTSDQFVQAAKAIENLGPGEKTTIAINGNSYSITLDSRKPTP